MIVIRPSNTADMATDLSSRATLGTIAQQFHTVKMGGR